MPPPPKLLQLIERFDDNLAAYKQGHYNETQARREFVDPLFKLLGWDIDNEQGYAEAYKDVVHIDFASPADVARHDQMVALVERMLDLHKRLAAEQMPHVKTVLQRHAKGGGDGSADRVVGL